MRALVAFTNQLGRWAVLVAALAVTSCSGGRETHTVPATEIKHARVAPTTDVPALLGLSIDGLRQRLGATKPLPARVAASLPSFASGAADSVTMFHTGGLALVANYNIHSRRVRNLVLLGHHEDSLMGRARLRLNAPNYLIMPMFYTGGNFHLLGLQVIATP